MFHIKICGITESDDAQLAVDAGADAIGLNFYRQSPRFVELEQAGEIIQVVGSQVAKVGLFVNEPLENMVHAFDTLGLDYIQLHGDEPVDVLEELHGRPVLRAFRSKGEDISEILSYLDQCQEKGCSPQAVIIDSHQPALYGGTGKTVDWEMLARCWDSSRPERLLLAGGLNPKNVADAIKMVRPWGVDVSSGVESQPGKKDPDLVQGFVQQATESLKTIGRLD